MRSTCSRPDAGKRLAIFAQALARLDRRATALLDCSCARERGSYAGEAAKIRVGAGICFALLHFCCTDASQDLK